MLDYLSAVRLSGVAVIAAVGYAITGTSAAQTPAPACSEPTGTPACITQIVRSDPSTFMSVTQPDGRVSTTWYPDAPATLVARRPRPMGADEAIAFAYANN